MKNCKVWNKALLFKTLLDIHSNKCSLWIRWVHAYYLIGKEVWLRSPRKADHPLFKNLLKIRDTLTNTTGSVQNSVMVLQSLQKNTKFCNAMAYDWLRTKEDSEPWMRMIWKNYIPPKHSFILWLAIHGRLNTKDLWINVFINNMCVFCKRQQETISHLFLRCTFVSSVWRRI